MRTLTKSLFLDSLLALGGLIFAASVYGGPYPGTTPQHTHSSVSQGGNLGVTRTSGLSVSTPAVSGEFRVKGVSYFSSFVGIGVDPPAVELDAQNSAANSNVWLGVKNDAKQYFIGVRGDNADTFQIYDNTLNTTRIAVSTGGWVGIGTTNPKTKLHIVGKSGPVISMAAMTANDQMILENNGNSYFNIISSTPSGVGNIQFWKSGALAPDGLFFYSHATDKLNFRAGGIQSLTLSSTTVTMPLSTHIRAYRSSTAQTINAGADTTIVWNTESYDALSDYSTTTGSFTVRTSGYYRITGAAQVTSGASAGIISVRLKVNNTIVSESLLQFLASNSQTITLADTYLLSVGDSVVFSLSNGTANSVTVNNTAGDSYCSFERSY